MVRHCSLRVIGDRYPAICEMAGGLSARPLERTSRGGSSSVEAAVMDSPWRRRASDAAVEITRAAAEAVRLMEAAVRRVEAVQGAGLTDQARMIARVK